MDKKVLWLLISIFGFIGSWIPTLLGASSFSGWSLLGSALGGFFGIFVFWKIDN